MWLLLLCKLAEDIRASPSPSGRRRREAPDEGPKLPKSSLTPRDERPVTVFVF